MASSNNPAISHIYSGRATGLVTRVQPGARNFAPKFQRPSERRQPRRNAWKQGIIAAMALVVCLTLGVVGADELLTRRNAGLAETAALTRQFYVGSILFYPDMGNHCHQLFFDNRDGRFADNGSVECTHAAAELAKEVPQNNWSDPHTAAAISQAFH